MKKLSLNRLWQGALAIAGFFLLWHFASTTGVFGRMSPEYSLLLLPPPEVVFKAFGEMIWSGYLWDQLSVSLVRVLVGFALSVVIAVPLGIGMATSPALNNVAEPFVRIFSPIPGVAWVPLAILWFGLGDKAAIFIITIGSIFPIMLNTVQGVRDVDDASGGCRTNDGRDSSADQAAGDVAQLIPYLMTGFRIGLGFAWRVVIAAEMVGVPKGIGYMLAVGQQHRPHRDHDCNHGDAGGADVGGGGVRLCSS